MARLRIDVSSVVLAFTLFGCGTVDPGPNFQVAEVVFDLNFFYCKVEPMLIRQRCSSGDPAKGDSQGCHGSEIGFRFQDPPPPSTPEERCNGIVPKNGQVPDQSQHNWGSASLNMRIDPNQAPLLLRPTNKLRHPREIFPEKSPDADLIRQWATRYSSR